MAVLGGFIGGWFSLQSTDRGLRAQTQSQAQEIQTLRSESLRDKRREAYEDYIDRSNAVVHAWGKIYQCTGPINARSYREYFSNLKSCGYKDQYAAEDEAAADAAGDKLLIYASQDIIVASSSMAQARLDIGLTVRHGEGTGDAIVAYEQAKGYFLTAACADVNLAMSTACNPL